MSPATAQGVVYQVTSGWQRSLQAGGLTQGQQAAVAQLVSSASELCGGGSAG